MRAGGGGWGGPVEPYTDRGAAGMRRRPGILLLGVGMNPTLQFLRDRPYHGTRTPYPAIEWGVGSGDRESRRIE